MTKHSGAFLTISELSAELQVPQHILRYWETRFPALRPLQRAGNRRYYRPDDVELARRIHRLLSVEGYTVRGAQQALGDKRGARPTIAAEPAAVAAPRSDPTAQGIDSEALIARLSAIRARLVAALG
ncbi:MAG: MerR family transcriptional regulator [Sphingobium sp.]|nr:MerR family transcriptional regulator [Sphingobium sp.]MBP6111091.1 MerR family transcriptional regulator [Sphingobium sp.]MBP8670931.1 MerR family transcriptional regulator [Sphingobium sp.]MBP9157954.1 MerR family transcriptional regulator [Sphingobium sp.]MCC6482039.1 MerR family transcriptional regulator [Sphingomonadaceae bacterium]